MNIISLEDLMPLLTVSYPVTILDSRHIVIHKGYINTIKTELLKYPVERITISPDKRLTLILTV